MDEVVLKYWPALIVPLAILIVPLPGYRFRNKLEPSLPNKILKNPVYCSFASFLIIWLTTFINKSDSSRDLIIFIISFISSLEIILLSILMLYAKLSLKEASRTQTFSYE